MKIARTLLLGSAFMLTLTAVAQAESKTLYIGGYGGSFEKTMREQVIPAFEKAHDVKVEYVAGNSTDTLAKIQAQKSAPPFDVILLDDGPMYQAIQLGVCKPLTDLPVDQLYDIARFPEDKAVAVGVVGTGLMYNKDYFDKQGWPAPTSWADLADPKYKGKVVIPPINNTYGLHALIMAAKMNGGGEEKIDPGFDFFIDKVNDNVLAYEPSPGKMTELFQSEQAVIGVWGTGRVHSFAKTGFPVAFVYPKEKAVTLLAVACAVEKPDASPLANELVKEMLTPHVQDLMVSEYGYGPVNKNVEVPEAAREFIPSGDTVDQLYNADWNDINAERENWTKRWNREVER
ncbi:ABC transporter substrate-binding protein [Paracoccus sp. CPCC 101403]|uniref:ABC transporter substrate-binding protein n=1 Tax=Paracoccus broussonetiae TaxID=3075834 RepID=A0ABU3E9R6_9RHOB|nr:ABC transporter substrate-binding protein [Paracoccus sp. CPCC 101403]MDT1060969.1 ABC transporter substrate-binding protein [Paracoccus sp. CPCC 101403]